MARSGVARSAFDLLSKFHMTRSAMTVPEPNELATLAVRVVTSIVRINRIVVSHGKSG